VPASPDADFPEGFLFGSSTAAHQVEGGNANTAFDNFEWGDGYRPLFGMIGVDRDDGLRRVVRPSARVLMESSRESDHFPLFEEAASG
jgi:beta-glucosidase/6-phospho-beta-glucosidase/beta-galactosidase